MYRMACLLALATALVAGGAARASDPTGGYLIVDKVVLDPSDSPTTIQIWGVFSIAKEKGGSDYTAAHGYLYYKVVEGKEDVCRKEWNDMKKAAGTGQVLAFGSSYQLDKIGKVRKPNAKPESPDTYPIGNGLTKLQYGDGYRPIANLFGYAAPQTPADGDLVPAGEITLVARNVADKKHAKAKYVFELESASGGKEESLVEAGDKETKWTPKLKLKAGEKYTWRVRATDSDWKGPVATSSFVVKGDK